MTRKHILSLIAVLALMSVAVSACSGLSASPTPTLPPPTPTSPVSVADSLAHAFIAAEEAKVAADYLALFSDDALFMDNSNPYMRERGAELFRNSQGLVIQLFQKEDYGIKFDSHFISEDGRYIALRGTYTDTGKDGNLATVPILIVLEVKDDKLIRQDDYYDSTPFY